MSVFLALVLAFIGGTWVGAHPEECKQSLKACAAWVNKCCEDKESCPKALDGAKPCCEPKAKYECPCQNRAITCKCDKGEPCTCGGFCACAKCPGK